MDVKPRLPIEELKRLERHEKNADRARRLRIVLLAIEGWTAPAIGMAVGLSRRICQRWVYRYNDLGWEGLDDRRGRKPQSPLTPEQEAAIHLLHRLGYSYLRPHLAIARRTGQRSKRFDNSGPRSSRPSRPNIRENGCASTSKTSRVSVNREPRQTCGPRKVHVPRPFGRPSTSICGCSVRSAPRRGMPRDCSVLN